MTLEQFQNYWNGFLTWLPFVIAALSAVRAGLVFLEGAFAIWINRTPESRFWAVWLKVMATLDYLSVSIPRHPQAIRTFAQWDANRQRAQMGVRTTKFLSLVLVTVLVAGQTACFLTPANERKATEQFARANYEVSLYIGEGLNVINSLLELGRISPDNAIKYATAFRAANSVQTAILNESIQYLQKDEATGKEILVITTAGQLRLESLLLSLNSAVNSAINDPAINFDSETRARITALTLAMKPLISQMISVIQRLKSDTPTAPPLRLQAGPQVQVNLRQLREQLNVNANLLAEVKQ